MTLLEIYIAGFIITAIWCAKVRAGIFLGGICSILWFITWIVMVIEVVRTSRK